MGISMFEMIENRLSNFLAQPEMYDDSPFSIKELRDCIIMFLIKDAYLLTEPKQSLRKHRGTDDDDIRMRDSRSLKYAQHYRDLQYSYIKDIAGVEVEELLPTDIETIHGKLEGHKKTPMQYFELNTLAEYPLLKSIVNKRICDVKKISNSTFIEYMKDYEKLVEMLIKKLDGSDEDVIFGTIALFTLEWKYNVELFYSCTVNAEMTSVEEIPVQRLSALCAQLSMPLAIDPTTTVHTESRFVLYRQKLIPAIYKYSDLDWKNKVENKMCHYITAQYLIKKDIVHKWDMAEAFAQYTTRKEWADFFREHYDIRKIYSPKEWTNKRIRYMRNIYKEMIKEQPTPKS